MSAVFMNSENSKTSDAHRVRFNLMNIMDLERGDKHVAFSDLSIYYA